MYGPCRTCIAWLVTEPEELAIGLAVADTFSANTAVGLAIVNSTAPSLRRCLLYWLRFLFLLLFVLLFDWSFLVQNNSGKIERILQDCLS